MKKIQKATWVKVAEVGVQTIPPVVTLLAMGPAFVTKTTTAISAAALLVGLIVALVFKDATKKFFTSQPAFKTTLVAFLFSLIAVSLGQQILIVSGVALVANGCSVPLHMWYDSLTRPITSDEMLNSLEVMVKENKANENRNETH